MDLKFTHDIGPNNKVILDKLFQFSILGAKLESSFYKMEQFNALCVRFQNFKNEYTINIECDINSHDSEKETPPVFTDRVSYFKDIDIINQFWGKSSYSTDNKSDFCNKAIEILNLNPENKSEVREEIYDEVVLIYKLCKDSTAPILIQESKEGIEPFIVIPLKSVFSKTKVKLKTENISRLKITAKYLSFGFWFQSSFKRKIKTIHDELFFDSRIEFPSVIKSPDFKVYFQIGAHIKIKSNQVSLDNGGEPIKAEIIRVFSQSKIKYFKDWADLGIYQAALLRFENSKKINGEIMLNGVRSVKSQLNLEDTSETSRKQLHLYILSLIVSVLVAMGFDATRQTSQDFTSYFPVVRFFTNELIWFLVCIGLIAKYKYLLIDDAVNKWYKFTVYLSFIPLIFWLFACFFIKPTVILGMANSVDFAQAEHESLPDQFISLDNLIQSLPVFDFWLNTYIVITLLLLKYYKNNEKGMHIAFRKIINIWSGVR